MNLPESRDRPSTYLWLAGNEGLENGMGKTIRGYTRITIRIHSVILT